MKIIATLLFIALVLIVIVLVTLEILRHAPTMPTDEAHYYPDNEDES